MKNLLSRKTRSSSAHFSGYCAFSDMIYPIVMQNSGIFKKEKYSIGLKHQLHKQGMSEVFKKIFWNDLQMCEMCSVTDLPFIFL